MAAIPCVTGPTRTAIAATVAVVAEEAASVSFLRNDPTTVATVEDVVLIRFKQNFWMDDERLAAAIRLLRASLVSEADVAEGAIIPLAMDLADDALDDALDASTF